VRGLAAGTETATILIVDDDEGVTQMFAPRLRLEGYQLRTAVTWLEDLVGLAPNLLGATS
jgi:DNA-binding NtrC family response regulator